MNESTNWPTRQIDSRRATLTGAIIIAGLLGAPSTGSAATARPNGLAAQLAQPHVLSDTDIADVIVRVRGGAICTGTPITDTTYVVTAAHCVLDDHGQVSASRTVLRNGVEYTAVAVLVDPDYHNSPGPRLDAAVLDMGHVIPGPSARLGDAFSANGTVTLAGFQPLDSDGSLLRGTRPDNRPRPMGTSGGVVHIGTAAAGCIHAASDVRVTRIQLTVPCGLIPGASGGGLFQEYNDEVVLTGIISTVGADLTYNGVTTLAAVHELIEDSAEYTHRMPFRAFNRGTANVVQY